MQAAEKCPRAWDIHERAAFFHEWPAFFYVRAAFFHARPAFSAKQIVLVTNPVFHGATKLTRCNQKHHHARARK